MYTYTCTYIHVHVYMYMYTYTCTCIHVHMLNIIMTCHVVWEGKHIGDKRLYNVFIVCGEFECKVTLCHIFHSNIILIRLEN